jgi:GABA permease
MSGTATKRILVVANETAEGAQLHETVRDRGNGSAEVHVVSPALNSRLRYWISDVDQARHAAEDRLAKCLGRLRGAGFDARGSVGDSDPLQAIADALHFFPADEIVIATHPEERSNWLERDLVERARSRYALPVVHVVVGPAELLPVAA